MNKILIVDDDRGIRLLLSEELGEEGYDVITCGDASRLMDMLEQSMPDIIVMDIRLGHQNSLDLLRHIRRRYENLPVIVCTAYPAIKDDMKSAAANYFVTKSFDLTELKSTVKTALDGVPKFQTAPWYDSASQCFAH